MLCCHQRCSSPNPGWTIAFPDPPCGDYPTGHSIEGGAAAAVLKSLGGTNAISFLVTNNAGKIRSFTSFSQAAPENSNSRIYAGHHVRNPTVKGQAPSDQIGIYVVGNALKY